MTFNIHRLVFGAYWAKSLSWQLTSKKETRVLYLAVQKVTEKSSNQDTYNLIIGPVSIIVGWAK